jgi:alkylation response protein AidB-like acyl-CoA dehydrogenase
MDLRFTAEQEAFRAEVRAWLGEHAPKERLPTVGSREGFDAHRAWEQQLGRAGYGALHWPVEYGGRGADVVTQAIFEEEYALAECPPRITVLGRNLMGPTLMAYGTPEQKDRWLSRILSADDIWSQGFSEPGAGSDLAGLNTRAVRDGDDFIVNGQKIWTSYGTFSDWIFALVRTDPEAPRHSGITFLAIDMQSPGVEARPLVQVDGRAGFAEVFFTDVRVPASTNVIGEVNRGWDVAMTTLGFERDAPSAPAGRFEQDVAQLGSIARTLGKAADPAILDTIGSLYAQALAYRHHTMRTLTKLARGERLGPEASITKVLWSELERETFERGRELLGPYGEVLSEEAPVPDPLRWHAKYWFARAATIYAGTSEVQRNIISERVLGLPRK